MVRTPTIEELTEGGPSPPTSPNEIRDVRALQYRYFQDLGSLLDFQRMDNIVEQAQEIIAWHRSHVKGLWAWTLDERNVCDHAGAIKDVRKYLWISFDLSEDAMLSRMTWRDLKGERYAIS